jgi:ATP-binding cassette subfamily F protein 3
VGRLATRVIELRADGLHDFMGGYDDYIAKDGADHLDVDAVALKAKKDKKDAATEAKTSQLSWEERKRRENRKKNLPKRRDQLLALIESSEKEKNEILEKYAEPTFYEKTKNADIEKLERRKTELDKVIEDSMAEWEQVEAELTELDAEVEA